MKERLGVSLQQADEKLFCNLIPNIIALKVRRSY